LAEEIQGILNLSREGETMKGYAKIVATCMLIMAVSACTTVGNKFDISKVDQLKPGVSTIADAQSLLGAPTSKSEMADHAELLQWQYVQGTVVGGSASHTAILFDRYGKMVRVTLRTQL
jgi:outer membrane protein assembly factor BamE (lipoprotein component of BamABCDE complex)